MAGEPEQGTGRIQRTRWIERWRCSWHPFRGLDLIGLVFLMELLVVLALSKTQPALGREFGRWLPLRVWAMADRSSSHEGSQFNPELDPQTGATAPDWRLRTINGRLVGRAEFLGRQITMVFIGQCTSCALKQIQLLLERPPSTSKEAILIVTTDSRERRQWLQDKVGNRAIVMQDVDQETARVYNAAWRPRTYIIDEHGVLGFCQDGKALSARSASRADTNLDRQRRKD
jgi:hypothetical protein